MEGRATLYWGRECALIGFAHSWIMHAVSLLARLHLRRQVPQRALRAALTPAYAMGCKRVLRSSIFYPTLSRAHVELVTEAIREVRQRPVVTADGTEREVDTLVFGTGFHAAEMLMARRIRGRDGRVLAHGWHSHGAAPQPGGGPVRGIKPRRIGWPVSRRHYCPGAGTARAGGRTGRR
jgi:cation diffusion facilitator CzcD-associated flavoprotein CzcO